MLNGLKKRLRKWLDVPDVTPKPKPKGGLFDLDTEIPASFLAPAKSWNDELERVSKMAIQAVQPKQFVKQTGIGMDGRMAFAYDDAGFDTSKTFMLGGFGDLPAQQLEWFAKHSFIGHQNCAMISQHWFISKACSMPARDAIRNGFDLSIVSADPTEETTPQKDDPVRAAILKEQAELDKRFKLKKNCIEAVRMMRTFGIRIVLFKVNSPDPDYYVKPFNPDGVTPGSYKGMSQVDPYWISPELDYTASADPASEFFFVPTWWRINGQRYHRTHLIIVLGPEVPDLLKPTYLYGGLSIPQLVFERIYASERVADEAPALAMTKRMTSVEGVDLMAAIANPAGFQKRVAMFTGWRDNYGAYFLGQGESVKQIDTALTDFDTLIMTQFQLACGIINIPSTKMMGTQPKGFNATGESEAANYREECESIQEHDMTPIIERHHMLSMRSYIMPKFALPAPIKYNIEWNELDPETSKEKSDRELQDAERDYHLAETGAIDGVDVRDRLRKDKQSSYYGITAIAPEGPRPQNVVLPDAPKTAPNTEPGVEPTNAPDVPAPATAPSAPNVPGSGAAPMPSGGK